jgi:hypothetical protein
VSHPFVVRRSDRARRARLTVTAAGEVVVVLPRGAPARIAAEMVGAHGAWIDRQLGRMGTERARIAARPPLVDGRLLEVYGIPHRVVLLAPDGRRRPRVERRLIPDEDGIAGLLEVAGVTDGVAPLVERWLRGEARSVIVRRVAERAPAVGVSPGSISIRAQRSRWGSASRDGSLSFNWRLVLAPPFVLDAVVVHELAHLVVRGHSARFWALARRHAPRTDEARAWLRTNHAALMTALD